MNATNGWPGKPGIPLNPEQDGWHWLEDTVDGLGTNHIEVVYYAAWSVPTWYRAGNRSPIKKPENWIYLGPVLSHDEAVALQKRCEEAERTALQAAEGHARETRRADALQKRVAELEGALKDAAASVKEWGAYASQYLQDKWDLPGEVARYIAIAEGKNDVALTGGKDE